MNLEFTAEDLIEQKRKQIEDRQASIWAKRKAAKAKIIAGEDVEANLEDYEYFSQKANEIYEISQKDYAKDIYENYALFERMAARLAYEFDATVSGDTIRFKWSGKTIGFVASIIAKIFDLHCGMFTFESSFTTHEVYTPNGHLMHIGIDRDDHDTVLIEAHLIKKD